jgi:hypothetical protein
VPGGDHSGLWLRNAAAGLCGLAAAAAAVSFTAQYRMAEAARHLPMVAALEAAIPDAAALVFACLGIALALHGRRALRPRALNLAAVGTSVFMNTIAAAPGWRNLAIWAMPPVAYALASDTLIAVVRAWSLARHQHLARTLAAEDATPLAIVAGLILWLLRLAPASTLAGFRAWVLAECPVAPGRRAPRPAPAPQTVPRKATKTARFLSDQENRCPAPEVLQQPRHRTRPDRRELRRRLGPDRPRRRQTRPVPRPGPPRPRPPPAGLARNRRPPDPRPGPPRPRDPETQTVSLVLDDTTANIALFAIAAHADEREAHLREVERSGRSLPEGSYGRRNRQAIAAREARVAARLRAVEQAYRLAIERDAVFASPEQDRVLRSPEHVADQEIELE